MYPRKPDLFDVTVLVLYDEILTKKCSALIDGDGMANDRNIAQNASVRQSTRLKSDRIKNPAHRTHCIPQTEEVGPAFFRKCLFETGGNPKSVRHGIKYLFQPK